MNRYLMLTAATLLATAHSAVAGQGSKTIDFNGYCDKIDISWNGYFYSGIHDWTACGIDSLVQSYGISGKTKGLYKNIFFWFANDSDFGSNDGFDIQLPLRTGNSYCLYTNGLSSCGTYTVESPGHYGPKGVSSTLDDLGARKLHSRPGPVGLR